MCHTSIVEFFINNVSKEDFQDKRILEVGSCYVNGSVRPFIENYLSPREYIGVDIQKGLHVDEVVPAERILEHFGKGSFDTVVTTEMLEHAPDWRLVINNLKAVLRHNGVLYLTTRSRGYPLHSYPYDYWRYEIEDMKAIFADFVISVEKDKEVPGVFLRARKPKDWTPEDLSPINLYSLPLGRRVGFVPAEGQMSLTRKIKAQFLRIGGGNPILTYIKEGIRRSIK